MKNLFLVHLGYYDDLSDGVFESHTNIFVVADDFEDARKIAKENDVVKSKKMHIDGLQQIEMVDGFKVQLQSTEETKTLITSHKFRELAPKKENK